MEAGHRQGAPEDSIDDRDVTRWARPDGWRCGITSELEQLVHVLADEGVHLRKLAPVLGKGLLLCD